MQSVIKQKNIFSKFTGIWKDRDITQESIRKKAWKTNKDLLNIEPISKDDKDYKYIVKGRAERISNPENYGTLDDVDWDYNDKEMSEIFEDANKLGNMLK